MATLPSKNALNDLSGGYYSYWTDGTTEGRATVAVLLGSTDAQAAAATARQSFGLVIGTNVQAYSANLDALAADPLTATTAASTYLTQASAASTYLTQATAASTYLTIASAASTYQPIGSYQASSANLTAIAALSSADGNFIVGSATGWVAESGATARTSLGLGTTDSPTFAGLTSTGLLNVSYSGANAYLSSTDTNSVRFRFRTGTTTERVTMVVTDSGVMSIETGGPSPIEAVSFNANRSSTFNSTLTLASGSITDSTGAISFGNENLSTTGTLASGNATVTGTLGVTGKITGAASTTSAATINLPAGTAPTSPAESDMWFVGDVMYRRIGGVTKSVTFT